MPLAHKKKFDIENLASLCNRRLLYIAGDRVVPQPPSPKPRPYKQILIPPVEVPGLPERTVKLILDIKCMAKNIRFFFDPHLVWLAEVCHSATSILPDWQLPGKMAEFLRGLAIFGRIRAANSSRPKNLPVATTPNRCNKLCSKKYK